MEDPDLTPYIHILDWKPRCQFVHWLRVPYLQACIAANSDQGARNLKVLHGEDEYIGTW